VIDLLGGEALDEGLLGAGEESIERLHADAAVASEVVVVAQPVIELFLE
jgi:hypothetical protein